MVSIDLSIFNINFSTITKICKIFFFSKKVNSLILHLIFLDNSIKDNFVGSRIKYVETFI